MPTQTVHDQLRPHGQVLAEIVFACTRVFRMAELFAGSLVGARLEGDNPVEMERCFPGPVMSRAALLRGRAQAALASVDADSRWQQLCSSGDRREMRTWCPGEEGFFWRAHKSSQPWPAGENVRALAGTRRHSRDMEVGQSYCYRQGVACLGGRATSPEYVARRASLANS